MISRILVAIDGSKHADKAFEYASDLAKKAEARLLIIHVFGELGSIGYSIAKELEQRDREMLQKIQISLLTIGDCIISSCYMMIIFSLSFLFHHHALL
jgi:nucleotide-binding universal stress UspA family protein